MATPPKPKILLTEKQKAMAHQLNCCRFLPASFDKRFAREVAGATELTERQIELLKQYYYKYRKQITAMFGDKLYT